MSENNDLRTLISGKEYEEYVIPEWCQMPSAYHNDGMGGCWGISYGDVAKEEKGWCYGHGDICEFAKREGEQMNPCRWCGTTAPTDKPYKGFCSYCCWHEAMGHWDGWDTEEEEEEEDDDL